LKNVLCLKSKISSTLAQLSGIFFNDTKPTVTKFEGLEKREE